MLTELWPTTDPTWQPRARQGKPSTPPSPSSLIPASAMPGMLNWLDYQAICTCCNYVHAVLMHSKMLVVRRYPFTGEPGIQCVTKCIMSLN